MVTALLLIIVAILLFGSSAVIGAAGAILGFLSLAAGLAWGSVVLDVHPGWILGGLVAVLAVLGALAHHYGPKV